MAPLKKRQELAQRLESTGCETDLSGTDWHTCGDFDSVFGDKRGFHRVDPQFTHLTVLYSQRTDSPDTPNPARPRYILNNKRNQAHFVSTWLEPFIAEHKTNWHTFDDKEALLQYFKDNNVDVHEHDPTPEDLDIKLK